MLVTLLPMLTEVKPLQSEKALLPMLVNKMVIFGAIKKIYSYLCNQKSNKTAKL